MDERLREVAVERGAVETALAAALGELTRAVDAADRSRLLGYVGNAERLLGRHEEAIAHLRESMQAAPPGVERARAVALIRLAEAYRCADRPVAAERSLREALQVIDAAGLDLRDFALQHLGKCLVDAGRPDEAIPLLEEALTLRRAKGATDLVVSTARALDWARARGSAT